MKKLLLSMLLLCSLLYSDGFDDYLKNFDYKARKDMKIKAVEMLNMLEDGTAQVIDLRGDNAKEFMQEYKKRI